MNKTTKKLLILDGNGITGRTAAAATGSGQHYCIGAVAVVGMGRTGGCAGLPIAKIPGI